MRDFLEFARAPRLQRLVDEVHRSPFVQGVVIDFDPFWLALAELRSLGFEERYIDERLLPRVLRHVASLAALRSSGVARDALLPSDWRDILASHLATEPFDFDASWRPRVWREFAAVSGSLDSDPRRAVISLRPVPSSLRLELAASFGSAARELGLDVATEIRPVALLGSTGGPGPAGGEAIYVASAQGSARATMGGFMMDGGGGRMYGLTCGHACANGDEIYGKPSLAANSRVGQCVASIAAPIALAGGCNPFRQSGGSGRADVAVVQLDGNPPSITRLRRAGRVSRIASPSEISQDQTAQVAASSGQRTVRLGGLCAYYELRDSDGVDYCYHDLLELKPSPQWFAPFGISRMPTSGDSGAWVHIAGPAGPEALAIFVASEPNAGYACYLEFALEEIAQLGLNLNVA